MYTFCKSFLFERRRFDPPARIARFFCDDASIYETAYICKMLGMTLAINLDGGGSTSLWGEATGIISHPCGNRLWDHLEERDVPNLIVAY